MVGPKSKEKGLTISRNLLRTRKTTFFFFLFLLALPPDIDLDLGSLFQRQIDLLPKLLLQQVRILMTT